MKHLLQLASAACIATLFSCNPTGSAVSNVKLDTSSDSLSYAFGVTIGDQLNGMEENIDLSNLDYDKLIQGIKDQRDSISAIEAEEAGAYLDAEFQRMYKANLEGKNRPEAEAFIATKKAEPGVQSTPSGLLYTVMQQGSGAIAAFGDYIGVAVVRQDVGWR